jgi:hypothetical protein
MTCHPSIRSRCIPESQFAIRRRFLFALAGAARDEWRMESLGGVAAVFGLGFGYFISAIPAGAALKIPIWLCATAAWAGYALGGAVVALAGEPVRRAIIAKFKIELHPARPGLIFRAWTRFGLPALGLLAPVTIGPQIGALMGLALGVPRGRLIAALALGVIPWCLAFAILAALGVRLLGS